jgi:catechol 2,3-dioxygenase-like lactoylglutathione lyase family enzyme
MGDSDLSAIDHVQVVAPPGCEPDARRFYGQLLGLPEIVKPAALAGRGGAWFTVGAQELHVGVEPDFAPARKAHPAFRVARKETLEALAARLSEAGSSVTWDSDLPGVVRFYVDDPWGNRLELLAPAGPE